jgi:hypothetical protein
MTSTGTISILFHPDNEGLQIPKSINIDSERRHLHVRKIQDLNGLTRHELLKHAKAPTEVRARGFLGASRHT